MTDTIEAKTSNMQTNSALPPEETERLGGEIVAALKTVFAENDQEKLKPVFANLLRSMADTSYYTWIGYFAAADLWRDRVKNFKPSRGLTINVHDVAIG